MSAKPCPGPHSVAHGACAWLAPVASRGWSNAGLITDKHGVAKVRQYLQFLREQARARHDAG